jgi:branched-chain amino acid aminotransferase
VLFTPDAAQNVLEGITRRTVVTLAKNELGLEVIERALDRSELYACDELFLTGTAAGITFVNSVDHRPVGDRTMGPVARALAELFERVSLGREPAYRHLVTPVYGGRGASLVASGVPAL